MVVFYGSLLRILNGIITLYLANILVQIYVSKKKRFFIYWAIGFLAYGINILIRLFLSEPLEITTTGIIVFILAYTGFTFMIIGIGSLVNQIRIFILISLTFPITLLLLALIDVTSTSLIWAIGIIPFLLIVLGLLGIQLRTGLDLKLLIYGWVSLLVINVIYLVGGIFSGYIDLLSALSKIVIFWGMTQPNFSMLEDDLKRFFVRGIPMEYAEENQRGGFILVEMGSRKDDTTWINNRVINNSKKGIRTVMLSYYDMITPSSIINGNIENDVFWVKIKAGRMTDEQVFNKQVISISDDVSRLNPLISDIIKFSDESHVPCEIILYSLSFAVLTHGWKRVYAFITANYSRIKSSSVRLVAFYSLDVHENKPDILKFTVMADQTLRTDLRSK